MITVGQIYDDLNDLAPFDTAEAFDNAGLLLGERRTEVKKAGVCLDITPEAVELAAQEGCGLIVSHHPVIFHPLRSLRPGTAPYLLAKYGIGAICAHTNLDKAEGGVNSALAECLGLQNIRPIPSGMGRMGETGHGFNAREFASYLKERLGSGAVAFAGKGEGIGTVALCGGAGFSEDYDAALAAGADAFVTGEVKHHEYLYAQECGMPVFAAGHFHTENVVAPVLEKRLREHFPELQVLRLAQQSPEQFV